ncbi:restriction endonuclease subunit S [Candidatus Pelagibacter sp. HIMB1746]|uniref:restriction endonuclease subunit S n=1 Tax=Candidatus Pelagibacter sp. HIMB1746 TaxID=3413370 RepID=UPI003F86BA87
MTNSLKMYQAVDSYWYDKVPSHWKKTKNKYVFNQNKHVVGENWKSLTLLTMGKSGVKPRNMDDGGKFPASFENYQTVEPNQLIFCLFDLDETPRTIGISKDYGMITSAYDVFSTTESNDPNFWTYFYQMLDDQKGLRPFYTGLRKVVRSETFMGIELFSPPLEEQKLISCYLDKKTMQIDRLVEQIQKKTELLKEQRISLINKSITKGLYPTVEMKESGVEWIGKVPKNWKVKKIKHLSIVKRGSSPRPIDDPKYFDNNGEYSWVRISDVTASGKYLEKTKEKLSELGSSLSTKIEKGDIFLSIAGSVGKPIITSIKCCIHDGFVWFEDLKVNIDFLFYVFLQGTCFQGLGKLGTQLNLNTDTVGDVYLPVPNHNEQMNIVKKLEKKLLQIQKCLDLETLRLKRLQEYRQSLIFSAVTGKFRISEDMI